MRGDFEKFRDQRFDLEFVGVRCAINFDDDALALAAAIDLDVHFDFDGGGVAGPESGESRDGGEQSFGEGVRDGE